MDITRSNPLVATVLTVYGIETLDCSSSMGGSAFKVATVLTVYGIETVKYSSLDLVKYMMGCNSTYRLRYWNEKDPNIQTVVIYNVATVLTVYGIETILWDIVTKSFCVFSCNSTYRLRYWNIPFLFTLTPYAFVATVLTVYGIETLQGKIRKVGHGSRLQQYLPFTVLKRAK